MAPARATGQRLPAALRLGLGVCLLCACAGRALAAAESGGQPAWYAGVLEQRREALGVLDAQQEGEEAEPSLRRGFERGSLAAIVFAGTLDVDLDGVTADQQAQRQVGASRSLLQLTGAPPPPAGRLGLASAAPAGDGSRSEQQDSSLLQSLATGNLVISGPPSSTATLLYNPGSGGRKLKGLAA